MTQTDAVEELENVQNSFTLATKCLTDEEKLKLAEQNKRMVSEFKANQLELNAQKHWDIFYKRNETRFFKDRHWTTREFEDLIATSTKEASEAATQRKLLEVGCGVGNLIFPLVQAQQNDSNGYYFYACDFSPRAIDFVRQNKLYDPTRMHAFQCDITTDTIHEHVPAASLDIITMVFVLSAIHPDKFDTVIKNLFKLLKPGGVVLFRDYGLYDMAQLRFKAGNKIGENFYMRSDGTRSYYFSEPKVRELFVENGFEVVSNQYVHRRTLNVKEGIDVPRIFLQGKFAKKTS